MKFLYAIPALLSCGLVATIGFDVGFGSLEPEAWGYVALLITAAVLLSMNKWWGSIFGMIVGGIVMYLSETANSHQHMNVTPLGIGIILYFAAMGLICCKFYKK